MTTTPTDLRARSSNGRRIRRIDIAVGLLLLFIVGLVAVVNRAEAGESCATGACDTIAVVDGGARFSLYSDTGPDAAVRQFYYGTPGAQALMGDWDCDGEATPAIYRQGAGLLYLRNDNSQGVAERQFYFGIPGDVALAGDFNGDGCDTVSIYRPSNQHFYISNRLGGGVAEYFFRFGIPGDEPLVGDFDGDGVDTVGVHRRSTGLVHLSNARSSGWADRSFSFGDPGDQVFAGDWDGDGIDTVAAYRPSSGMLYLKNTNTGGAADTTLSVGPVVSAHAVSGLASFEAGTSPRAVPVSRVVDVEVWPGDDLRSVVSSAPAGTVFRINGRHSGQAVRPKDRQVFVGASGAVLDGGGRVEYAFRSGAVGVVIEGLEITGYASDSQDGAIQASGDGWVIENNEIHHNGAVGVKIYRADRAVIAGNDIHHNEQLGISVAYSSGTVVEGNEIAFNNWRQSFKWGWEAGGTKFWSTNGLVVRDNWSHDNHGPGLWTDHDNVDTLYEGNLVEDNYANGIFHEISYGAVIRNNTIRRNGFGHDAWLWGGGIVLSSSSGVNVYGNVLTGNYNGITMVQQSRGSGDQGPYVVKNNRVHDNLVVDSGISGAAQDIGTSAIFNANNTFTANDYRGTSRWEWENRRRTWDTWRSYGHDRDGTYRN